MKLTMEQARKKMEKHGGSLDLSNTPITALPDNLTVGGWLDLRGTQITAEQSKKVRKLKDGDCVPGKYIYCDGI